MPESDPNGQRKPPSGQPPQPPVKMSRGVIGWIAFIGLALMLMMMLTDQFERNKSMPLSDFMIYVKNGQVASVEFPQEGSDGKAIGQLTPEAIEGQDPMTPLRFEVEITASQVDKVIELLQTEGAATEYAIRSGASPFVQILISVLPWVVMFAFIWFFVFRQIRTASGGAGMLGNFGRSRHRIATKEHANVTFQDVAGIDEAKEEVSELVEFLKNPKKFQRLGGRAPRGVLLVGEPGCGKTMLAKAIAGEADVPFFSISGSDFVEMFVGVGASRVRDLFKQARENSPCIIFLDEIDAVGRRRGAGFSGGGHDEREQTLNAILVEMDGFDTSDQVIVMAATNRSDVLDPALIRPGRFDRQVFVPLPDIGGRLEILKLYARKVKAGPDIELRKLAQGTPMFSGADLAAIINEAAILASMGGKEYIENEDLEEARDKIRWGRAHKTRKLDAQERRITAYHEAGHALLQSLLPDADPLHKVSIIPRGQALGATFNLPEKDRYTMSLRQASAQLAILLGGRLAEKEFCDDFTSGASNDIKQATLLSRTMVCDWGMSEKLGPVRYSADEDRSAFWPVGGSDLSEQTTQLIDQEVRSFIEQAKQKAHDIILEHRQAIDNICQALLKYETLTGDEVRRLIAGETLDKPTVADLIDAQVQDDNASAEVQPNPPQVDAKPDLPDSGPLPQPDVG